MNTRVEVTISATLAAVVDGRAANKADEVAHALLHMYNFRAPTRLVTWEAWFEAFADAGPLVEQLYEISKEPNAFLSLDDKNACAFLLSLVGVANQPIYA